MMQAAGVAGEPQILFWRPLETHERFQSGGGRSAVG
jgi:hypothetical protein